MGKDPLPWKPEQGGSNSRRAGREFPSETLTQSYGAEDFGRHSMS